MAQSPKKPLDHSSYDTWSTIQHVKITNDGKWTSYQLQPRQGDPIVKLYDSKGTVQGSYSRANSASFSWDLDFLIFRISAPLDTIENMRRRKVEKEHLPKDTLAILNLKTKRLEKIPNVKSFTLPEEWYGHLTYLLEPIQVPEDTTIADSLRVAPKPNNDDNGFTLVLRELKRRAGRTLAHNVIKLTRKIHNASCLCGTDVLLFSWQ